MLASIPASTFSDELAAHPLQVLKLIQPETVEVAVTVDQAAGDELIDELVAQPLDVHRIAAGVVADPLA